MSFYSRKKKLIIYAAATIFMIVLCFYVFTEFSRIQTEAAGNADNYTATDYLKRMQGVLIDGEYYRRKAGIKTYLFIGLDKTGPIVSSNSYKNLNNADFLLLAVVNSDKKTINLIEIDRDTMTNIRRMDLFGRSIGSIEAQIALSYSYGDGLERSAMNTVMTVSDLLYGLGIDYYFVINMDGAVSALNLFGKVPVLLDNDYTEINSSYQKGRVVSMDAEEGLAFSRARRGLEDPTNQARVERQKLYINSFIDNLSAVDFPTEELTSFLDAEKHLSVTNINVATALDLYNAAVTYSIKEVTTVAGVTVEGTDHMEFYPDAEALKALCCEVLYDKF